MAPCELAWRQTLLHAKVLQLVQYVTILTFILTSRWCSYSEALSKRIRIVFAFPFEIIYIFFTFYLCHVVTK